eukprot:7901230-Pyramimonas_sp.AAC.1
MEKMLDADLREASGVERPSTGDAVQRASHGQGGDVSDIQPEEESSHSMEKYEEYARFHTSPRPSHHVKSLLDLYGNPSHDRAMIEATQKATLDSDDERLTQGGDSSAQPIGYPPDAARTIRSAREVTGATPRPLAKK